MKTWIYLIILISIFSCKSANDVHNKEFIRSDIQNNALLQLKTQTKFITPIELNKITSGSNGTKIILIRHAEKRTDSDDPALSKTGDNRAKKLVKLFEDISLDAIYSTDYKRTRQTVQALAEIQKIQTSLYKVTEPNKFAKVLLERHPNQVVLIVGHSNTVPNLIQAFLGTEKLEVIDHDIYDKFYFIQTNKVDQGRLSEYKY